VVDHSDWLIIALSDYGETVSYPELEAALKTVFGDSIDYFIPIHHEKMGSYTSINVLFDGYVFLKDSELNRNKLLNIKESRMFSGPLKICGKIRTLTFKELNALRRKLRNSVNKKFKPGLKVKIHDGMFQNLDGDIISMEEGGKIANVRILCLSREIIAPIPTTCLEGLS